MVPYLSLYLITVALYPFYNYMNDNLKKITIGSLFIFFLLILGLRFEVGGDWFNFLANYEQLDSGIWNDNIYFQASEPIYDIVLKLSRTFDLSLAGLNIVLSFLLLSSIFLISFQFNNPLLAIIIAIPYILVVFGMGYINQSTAFAFIIFGIFYFLRNEQIKSLVFVLISIGFHYSAIVFLPIYIIKYISGKKINLSFLQIIIILLSLLFFFIVLLFFFDQYYGIYKYYLNPNLYTSHGAYIRLIINALVFILFFLFYSDLNLSIEEKIIYFYTFTIFIICFTLLVFQSSTGADRLNLYVLFIQIFLLPKIIELKIINNLKAITSTIVIIIYGFMLVFWLEFANHKNAWVPYQMFFFEKYNIYFRVFP